MKGAIIDPETLQPPESLLLSFVLDAAIWNDSINTSLTTKITRSVDAREGGFALDDIPSGKYDITIEVQDYSKIQLKDIEIKAGEITDLGKIELPKSFAIHGKVIDAEDQSPVQGASVIGYAPVVGDRHEFVTEEDGSFKFLNISKGLTILYCMLSPVSLVQIIPFTLLLLKVKHTRLKLQGGKSCKCYPNCY